MSTKDIKFIVRLSTKENGKKRQYYWNEDIHEWARTKKNASPVPFKRAKVYARDWKKYNVEVIMHVNDVK